MSEPYQVLICPEPYKVLTCQSLTKSVPAPTTCNLALPVKELCAYSITLSSVPTMSFLIQRYSWTLMALYYMQVDEAVAMPVLPTERGYFCTNAPEHAIVEHRGYSGDQTTHLNRGLSNTTPTDPSQRLRRFARAQRWLLTKGAIARLQEDEAITVPFVSTEHAERPRRWDCAFSLTQLYCRFFHFYSREFRRANARARARA